MNKKLLKYKLSLWGSIALFLTTSILFTFQIIPHSIIMIHGIVIIITGIGLMYGMIGPILIEEDDVKEATKS